MAFVFGSVRVLCSCSVQHPLLLWGLECDIRTMVSVWCVLLGRVSMLLVSKLVLRVPRTRCIAAGFSVLWVNLHLPSCRNW